eukprot:GFUD01037782.1.p1 GENE.GFUD01037782.1~~GFUD01037782.1.p1  ORF type:complete len:346 (-),score=70.82 GFUD01037782.1:132-1121(-)
MNYLSTVIFVMSELFVIEAAPKLKKNNTEFMEVGFYKGRTDQSLTEIAVTVRHKDMLEEGKDIDVNDLSVEVKAGDGCWTQILENPLRKGKDKSMWKVKIVPCKEYLVRVGVKRDGCIEYFQYPEAVGPALKEDLASSQFKPKSPGNISVELLGTDSVTVSWSPSECAESYELWYESEDRLDKGTLTVSAGFGSVLIMGLENCGDYTLRIAARLGEIFSNEGEADFTTCRGNSRKTLDTITGEQTLDSPVSAACESIIKQCELPTPRFVNPSSSDTSLLPGEVVGVSVEPETEFEENSDTKAQTGQANRSYESQVRALLLQMVLILTVL